MNITKDEAQDFFDIKKIFYIDSNDLSELTNKVYGVHIKMLESPNDSTHEYSSIDGKLDEYDRKTLAEAISNKYLEHYSFYVIFNDLVAKDILEPGDYFVRVSW